MALYQALSDQLARIEKTNFGSAGLRERNDLQRLLKNQISVIDPGILVIDEEFGGWEDSSRRIDLLGIDKDAKLVVIELKRTEDGGHMELQAIRYAAMVSAMTFDRAAEIYEGFLTREGQGEIDSRSEILEFLGWDEPKEELFAQDVRIVLVSANFSKEITTSVLWLNSRDLDITCYRLIPYGYDGQTLVDVQQIIPLPEAADYQIRIKAKERSERQDSSERDALLSSFWEGLLDIGRRKSSLHEGIFTAKRWGAMHLRTERGMLFAYTLSSSSSRVELYISRGDAERNKQTYDELHTHKSEIEAAFGRPLSWERLEERKSSRIAYRFDRGHSIDRADWPELQAEMVDAMIRFERALAPHVSRVT